jgi:hypothetical protein
MRKCEYFGDVQMNGYADGQMPIDADLENVRMEMLAIVEMLLIKEHFEIVIINRHICTSKISHIKHYQSLSCDEDTLFFFCWSC